MVGPAPKETQGIPTRENTKIVYLPTQETEWREKVAQHVRNIPEIGSSFTEKEATPPVTQPLPESHEMGKIGAERIGAEQVIDIKDVTDTIGNTVGSTVKEKIFGDQTHVGTTGGNVPILIARRKSLKKAA